MRGDKYKEAAAFYEPIVRQNYGDILSVSAAVLGIYSNENNDIIEFHFWVWRKNEDI